MLKNLALSALLLVAFVSLVSVEATAQRRSKSAPTFTVVAPEVTPTVTVELAAGEAVSADLDQCRNGGVGEPVVVCANSGWVNGNTGPENAHWAESQYMPYRMKMGDIVPGSTGNVLIIGYDILKGTKHAIDYLGTYNATATDADPCTDIADGPTNWCSGPGTQSPIIPKDTATVHGFNSPVTGNPIVQEDGYFTIWGGTITNVEYVNPYGGGEERQIKITFNAAAGVSNPVIAWGGHIAWIGDWGAGNSASAISGSPYHMRNTSINGKGGNQDRSTKNTAVFSSGRLVIIKEVLTPDGTNASNAAFTFDASAFFPATNTFQLTDDDPTSGIDGPGIDIRGSSAIFTSNEPIFVSEEIFGGFTLFDITCDDSDSGIFANADQNVYLGTLRALVAEGEIVTCTFTNGLQNASAAPVYISGRVTDAYGRGLSMARITVYNLSANTSKTVTTSTFGYYKVEDLAGGDYFFVSVSHPRYTFLNPSASFSLEDNLTGLDFRASR